MGNAIVWRRHQRICPLRKRRKVKDFFTKHTLDFVVRRLLGGLAEMDTDDIGGLANLLSDSRASVGMREQGKAATLRYL